MKRGGEIYQKSMWIPSLEILRNLTLMHLVFILKLLPQFLKFYIGTIIADKCKDLLKRTLKIPQTDAQIQQIIGDIDVKNNNHIELNEYLNWMQKHYRS